MVVVYAGSASAGVALGVLRENSFTLAVAETVEAVLSDRTREHTTAAVLAALKGAAEKARTIYASTPTFSAHGVPSIGYAVLESPWSSTCAVGAERVFPGETKITKEILEELAREAVASECVPPAPSVVRDNTFEATTVRVLLNGYPTAQPTSKYATHVALRAIVSSADSVVLSAATEVLTSFGIGTPIFRSGARALFSVARRVADWDEEYVLAHLTDGSLYFLVVREGVPTVSIVIPLGLHEILKRVSGERLPEETLSLFSMTGRGTCSEVACAAFQEALVKFEPEFVRAIGESMTEMSGGRKLPQRLILHADGRVLEWLSSVFSRIDFEQFTMTAKPYSVRPLILPGTLVTENDGVRAESSLKIASALVSLEISAV